MILHIVLLSINVTVNSALVIAGILETFYMSVSLYGVLLLVWTFTKELSILCMLYVIDKVNQSSDNVKLHQAIYFLEEEDSNSDEEQVDNNS